MNNKETYFSCQKHIFTIIYTVLVEVKFCLLASNNMHHTESFYQQMSYLQALEYQLEFLATFSKSTTP